MTTLLEIPKIEVVSVFAPTNPNYADPKIPVKDSFAWDKILEELDIPPGMFIALYAFRSIKNPDVDEVELERLDRLALGAAETAEGFLHYEPNPGLSYCVWRGSTDTRSAINSKQHREAAAYADQAYSYKKLEPWLIGRLSTRPQVEFITTTI